MVKNHAKGEKCAMYINNIDNNNEKFILRHKMLRASSAAQANAMATLPMTSIFWQKLPGISFF